MNTTRSTWREPMVWMLVGLPLASVAIGFALLFAAVKPSGGDADTVEHTTQVGKLLVAARDRAAPEAMDTRGLVVRVRGDMIEAVPVDGGFPRGGRLMLTLTSADGTAPVQHIELSPSELGWRGVGALAGRADRVVQLRPEDASWNLQGRWSASAAAVRLTP
jgi:uncharacterized protein